MTSIDSGKPDQPPSEEGSQVSLPQATRSTPFYTREPFLLPDAPRLAGAWFTPTQRLHEVVLVGLPGTALLSSCYEQNLLWLETLTKAGFRVLLLDYRGHGESETDIPLDKLRLAHYVEDVKRVLKWAGLTPPQVFLFGHSLGAAVALEVAANAESEAPFAGVALLGGLAPSRWRRIYLRGLPLNFIRFPRASWRAMRNPQEFFLNRRFGRELLFQDSTAEETVETCLVTHTCPESVRAMFDLCFAIKTRPLAVRRLLGLSGGNDRCVSPDEAYRSKLLQ